MENAKIISLSYFPDTSERWPTDVKIIVSLAMLMGGIGALNVAADAWTTYRPASFVTVGGGFRFDTRLSTAVSIGFESARLLGSALLLAGAIAFFARKRAARKLLLCGAVLALLLVVCGASLYWYYEITGRARPLASSAGDWMIKALWQLERLIEEVAIPILLIAVLKRPAIRAKFKIAGA